MIDGITPLQWLNAGSSVLSSALAPRPAAPSTAVLSNEQSFDFGQWTVATSGSKAEGGAAGLSLSPWLIFGAVVVVALAWKSRKS